MSIKMNRMAGKRRLRYYLAYSFFFVLIGSVLLYFYYSQGKSMIEASGDGFRQHYRALVYYGDYLRKIFGNFLHGQFVIPHWDFAIGEGSDILISLQYYCIGDIFTSLCFLFPGKYMYLYYDLISLMRLYCSGIAFSELCFYKGKTNDLIIMAGAIMYAYCSLSLSNMGGHVFFLSAAFYLPLIILGVEKIINGDKPFTLTIAVMLSSLSNIYFFYMNVISTVVFTAVRMLLLKKEWKERIMIALKITAYSFLGVLMSAVIFLPMLNELLTNVRFESKVAFDPFYPLSDYRDFYIWFSFNGHRHFGGYTVLGVLSLLHLYLKKRNWTLGVLFILGVIFTCLPFFGALYNAMVFPTDRWLYAVSLLVDYIIVDIFDDVYEINTNFLPNLCLALIFYISCILLDKEQLKIHAMFLNIAVFLCLFLKYVRKEKLCSLLCLGIAVFSMFFDAVYLYSPWFWYRSEGGKPISELHEMAKEEYSIFDYIEDDSFFRYSGNHLTTNESIHGKQSSTQYYWSVVNDGVIDFRRQLGLSDNNNHHYSNYDERFALNALAGVKYYILRGLGSSPYGFTYLDNYNGHDVYKSSYALPMIYGYDAYLTREQFDQLDVVEKNEVISSMAVLDSKPEGIKEGKFSRDYYEVDYSIDSIEGITLSDKSFIVEEGDGHLFISCRADYTGEYYLVVEGMYSEESMNIGVYTDDTEKLLRFKGSNDTHYMDRHDYVINLGYYEGFDKQIELYSPDRCSVDFDSIRIIYQPLDKQLESLNKLEELKVNNFVIGNDQIKADISTDENKILCFSIPYSDGWKAYLDGKKVELFNCNLQYMGINVEKGDHTIELRYDTPMLREGTIISVISTLAFFGLVYLERKKHKQ